MAKKTESFMEYMDREKQSILPGKSFMPSIERAHERPQSREDIDTNVYIGEVNETDMLPPNNESLSSISRTTFTPADDLVVINDLLFDDVPLTAIGTESIHDTMVSETLRNRSSIVVSKGNRTFRLSITLVFDPGRESQQKLHRLMSQITKNPLTFIYNPVIKQRMNISLDETTMFMLENGNIRNSAQNTGNIVLDLHFTYFNYKPFTSSFMYNSKLKGYTPNRDYYSPEDNTKSITDIYGHNTPEFFVEKRAETIFGEIGNVNNDLAGTYNTPVTFPYESDAWMYYANHLQSLVPEIDDYTSDCVGFTARNFTLINPTDPRARLSQASIEEVFSGSVTYPEIQERYKTTDYTKLTAGQRQTLSFIKAGTKAALETSGNRATRNFISESELAVIKKQYKASVSPMRQTSYIVEKGNVDDSHFRKHAYAGKRGMKSHAGLDLNAKMSTPAHSPADGIVVGVQAFEGSGLNFQIQHTEQYGGVTTWWMHMQKIIVSAGDQIKRGQLVGYVGNSQHKDGTGATSTHIHFEVLWPGVSSVDKPAYPGSRNPDLFYLRMDPKDWLKSINADFYKTHESSGRKRVKKQPRTGHEEDKNKSVPKKYVDVVESDNQEKQNARQKMDLKRKRKTNATREKDKNKAIPDPTIREKWIQEIKNKYGYEYYESSNVKNVFYKDFKVQVASDPDMQKNGKALPGIVCSSISLGFGHRVAPMHLIGQDYYTYQFLGAGSKMGTMVFTYAGEQGRHSVQKIKQIIDVAHNAARFYHNIPEAGTISLSSIIEDTDEKNSILRLVGAKTITVTKVNDFTVPEGADKHQLVIEFVVQEFDEEREILQSKNSESVTERVNMFKRLMSYVVPRGKNRITGNPIVLAPHPSIAVGSAREEGGRWKLANDSVPSWLLEIIVDFIKRLTKINDQMPPIDWPTGVDAASRWRDLYTLFNCGDLLWGYEKNIERPFFYDINDEDRLRTKEDSEFSNYSWNPYINKDIVLPEKSKAEMYRDRIAINFRDYQKFPETGSLHFSLYRDFQRLVGDTVKRIESNRADITGFKKYFPGVSNDFYERVQEEFNSCYPDLDLPVIPGLDKTDIERITLPPDFYVYTDNDESAIGLLTDRKNAENLLKQHMVNELKSIKHYITKSALGNAYISQNMHKIIQERRDIQDLHEEFYDWGQDIYYDGGKMWDPIFFKYDDDRYNTDAGEVWKATVKEHYISGKGESLDISESFMDDVISSNSYIRLGKNWPGGNPTTKQLIQTYYGEAHSKLSFGPSPISRFVDKRIKGIPTTDFNSSEGQIESLQKIKEEAKQTGRVIEVQGTDMYVHPDGTVTYGSSEAEREQEKEELKKHSAPQKDKYAADFNETSNRYGKKAEQETKDKFDSKKWSQAQKAELMNQINEESNDLDSLSPSIEDRYARTAAGIAIGARQNDLTIKRVLPTFRIYFIESDLEVDSTVDNVATHGFDDFYSYNSVQDIRIHESQKNPGSIAIITITNVGNRLFNKRFGNYDDYTEEERTKHGIGTEKQGIFSDTELENPFEKLIMKEGVKVQIRLGYDGHEDNLTTRFLGQIVEVSPKENGRLVEIVCQSYGAELEADEIGPLDDGPEFPSSQAALSTAIIQPFVQNFGRWKKNALYNPAEIRTADTGLNPKLDKSPWQLFKELGSTVLKLMIPHGVGLFFIDDYRDPAYYENRVYQYEFKQFPQDDNIFAPPPYFYTDSMFKWADDGCRYRPLEQTPWEVFKEHELRHPGFISYPVPYGNSPRMTMFFGPSHQHYWSRPPTELEIKLATKAYNEVVQLRGVGYEGLKDAGYLNRIKNLAKTNPDLAKALVKDLVLASAPTNAAREIGRMFGRYVPFRNYHFATSSHHILKNTVRTSIDGTFNCAEVLYSPGSGFNQDTNDVEDKEDRQDLHNQHSMYSCKLDENIPESNIRTYREEFPSCVTDEMAKRYAQGLFVLGLKDMYKGELVMIGNEKVKPYDIIHIQDVVNDMHGPVEVKSVTHVLSRDTGYATIVEPGLCVSVNDMLGASMIELMPEAMQYLYSGDVIREYASTLSSAKDASMGSVAIFGALKIMEFTQEGSPVAITPLIFKGRPFTSVVLGSESGSYFAKIHGQWAQWKEDFSEGYRKFDLSEEFSSWFTDYKESKIGPDY